MIKDYPVPPIKKDRTKEYLITLVVILIAMILVLGFTQSDKDILDEDCNDYTGLEYEMCFADQQYAKRERTFNQ